jgi:hypothetical protein
VTLCVSRDPGGLAAPAIAARVMDQPANAAAPHLSHMPLSSSRRRTVAACLIFPQLSPSRSYD